MELSTVLNQGTEEEEEEEEGCSFTQGLLSVMKQLAGPERERGLGGWGWVAQVNTLDALDATPKRIAHKCHVCHHKPSVDYCTERLYNRQMR